MSKLSDSAQQKLWYLAIFGLGLSLLLHMSSFIVIKSVLDLAGFSYILIVILIIPFSAMIYDLNTNKPTDNPSYSNTLNVFLLQLSHIQQAMMIGVLVYTAFNFIYTMQHIEGQSEILASGYAINNRGHLKAVTQQEFYKNRAFEVRFFSGHLFIFYMLTVLYFRTTYRSRQHSQPT